MKELIETVASIERLGIKLKYKCIKCGLEFDDPNILVDHGLMCRVKV
jgi:hypothetical protein